MYVVCAMCDVRYAQVFETFSFILFTFVSWFIVETVAKALILMRLLAYYWIP